VATVLASFVLAPGAHAEEAPPDPIPDPSLPLPSIPEGDFSLPPVSDNPALPAENNWTPPEVWVPGTPEQRLAIMRLTAGGGVVNEEVGPDGTLYIQDGSGYAAGMSPNPWLVLGLDGSTTLLAPAPNSGEVPSDANAALRLVVPATDGVAFTVFNSSPVATHVLVTWEVGGNRVFRWKSLSPGESWSAELQGSSGTSGAGVLITSSESAGQFEDDIVTVIAAPKN
jgi:hypothetical protein